MKILRERLEPINNESLYTNLLRYAEWPPKYNMKNVQYKQYIQVRTFLTWHRQAINSKQIYMEIKQNVSGTLLWRSQRQVYHASLFFFFCVN